MKSGWLSAVASEKPQKSLSHVKRWQAANNLRNKRKSVTEPLLNEDPKVAKDKWVEQVLCCKLKNNLLIMVVWKLYRLCNSSWLLLLVIMTTLTVLVSRHCLNASKYCLAKKRVIKLKRNFYSAVNLSPLFVCLCFQCWTSSWWSSTASCSSWTRKRWVGMLPSRRVCCLISSSPTELQLVRGQTRNKRGWSSKKRVGPFFTHLLKVQVLYTSPATSLCILFQLLVNATVFSAHHVALTQCI